jgi:hypothetical protein
MDLQKSITKPTVMAGKKQQQYVKKATSAPKNIPNQNAVQAPQTNGKTANSPTTTLADDIRMKVANGLSAATTRKETSLNNLLTQLALSPSPLLLPAEKSTWVNAYLEVHMPEEWHDNPILIGSNLITLRGVVLFDPMITEIKTREKQEKILLGKFLLRVWNQQVSPTAPDVFTQINSSTIYATGFEQIAENIRGLKSGDHVMVRGYLNSRKYERTFEGNAENVTATCYDTSVTIKSLIKLLSTPLRSGTSAPSDEYVLPEIPYETQDI